VEKLKRMEEITLPEDMDYQNIHGFSREVREKLNKVRPVSLGQASRISGITPAALMAIQVHLKKRGAISR
jgi:tRNA uridine 5-carboxymethylaminomethyl modification enzyme